MASFSFAVWEIILTFAVLNRNPPCEHYGKRYKPRRYPAPPLSPPQPTTRTAISAQASLPHLSFLHSSSPAVPSTPAPSVGKSTCCRTHYRPSQRTDTSSAAARPFPPTTNTCVSSTLDPSRSTPTTSHRLVRSLVGTYLLLAKVEKSNAISTKCCFFAITFTFAYKRLICKSLLQVKATILPSLAFTFIEQMSYFDVKVWTNSLKK